MAVSGQYLGGSSQGYGDGYPPLSPRSTARNQNNRPQSSPPQKVMILALLYISMRETTQILMISVNDPNGVDFSFDGVFFTLSFNYRGVL